MTSPKVLVIGCGVAGPVIALLLKKKGYEPIVLEKVGKIGDVGGSLMMQSNGLKVLSLLGLDEVVTSSSPHILEVRDQKSTGEDLGVSDFPSLWKEKYGQPGCGVKRTVLNFALKEELEQQNIEIREGWKLNNIVEYRDKVVVVSEDGRSEEGSFLVGCDGIKSVARALVLAQHGLSQGEASFTGLTQIGGISPTPPSFRSRPGMLNLYGPSAHFICYPISSTMTAWAITQKSPIETQETWKSFSLAETIEHRNHLLSKFKNWSSPVPELILGADKLIKYGLYDRPQLTPEQWHSKGSGRCILIGDAAHPTSPHLGQGANQALEDCYHLSRLIPKFKEESDLNSVALSWIFSEFSELRQPRTASLVKGARVQGEDRVVDGGSEASEERDARFRRRWENKEEVEKRFDYLLREPFHVTK